MTSPSLREQAERLPQLPGVYYFKDASGRIVYVGKARRLRTRVMQYINGHDSREMVSRLVRSSGTVEATITETEKGALILEADEIRRHRPRFNVRLIDGASFLHFEMDSTHPWPRIVLTRFVRPRKGVKHIGPFPDATSARTTLTFLERNFPFRTCSDERLKREQRPCLEHQMHRCLAPCVELCEPEEYQDVLEQAVAFLTGRNQQLIGALQRRMTALSTAQRFEEAIRYRELLKSFNITFEAQRVQGRNRKNEDYWSVHQVGHSGVFCVLPYRGGQLRKAITVAFSQAVEETLPERLEALLNAWYEHDIPHRILLPTEPTSKGVLEELLSERAGRGVEVLIPQRGEKKKRVQLAQSNAESRYKQLLSQAEQRRELLRTIKRRFRLRKLPLRIECFDNSTLQGQSPVAAMVVFKEGQKDRHSYRRFQLKSVSIPDDYAAMYEVLKRRFIRSLDAHASSNWTRPQLLVIDGGRGHINVALRVLAELEIHDVDVLGIAKPRTERKKGQRFAQDKIIIPNVKDPIRMRETDPVLLFFSACS